MVQWVFFGLMVHGDVMKILKFKDVLKIETQGKQYKWKIVAWSAFRNSDKIQWTLQESQWFDQKKDCIADFKEKKWKMVMMLQTAGGWRKLIEASIYALKILKLVMHLISTCWDFPCLDDHTRCVYINKREQLSKFIWIDSGLTNGHDGTS